MAAKLRPSHGSMTSLASLFECGHVRAVETRDIRVPQARKEGKLMRELRARAAPLGPPPLPVGIVHGRCGGTGVRRAPGIDVQRQRRAGNVHGRSCAR